MNEAEMNCEMAEEAMESGEQADSSKIMGNIYIKEELIIPDEPVEEGCEGAEAENPEEEFQVSGEEEDSSKQDDFGDPDPGTDLNVLYEAWRNYNRSKKEKKKKRTQVLEIYRDENYWTEDRYTDDEEFNYPKC